MVQNIDDDMSAGAEGDTVVKNQNQQIKEILHESYFQVAKKRFKIPSDECVGVILDFFFDSTAKTLVIYREFWYFSRIFPTLFSQLISIFMSLLHTFSKGVKIDARLPRSERFASIMRSGVLLRPPVSAGVLEPLKKNGRNP